MALKGAFVELVSPSPHLGPGNPTLSLADEWGQGAPEKRESCVLPGSLLSQRFQKFSSALQWAKVSQQEREPGKETDAVRGGSLNW